MTIRPRDLTDLYLSPLALELDRRLQRLSGLTTRQLDVEVAAATDCEPTPLDRRALLLLALTDQLATRGWDVSWDPRGMRLGHGSHSLVLGVPDTVRSYLRTG